MLRRRVWSKYRRQIYPEHLLACPWTKCATITKGLHTLARKLEAVHRKTVMRRKMIPSVCLARRLGETAIGSSMMCSSSRSVCVMSPLLTLARGCKSADCLGSDPGMRGFYCFVMFPVIEDREGRGQFIISYIQSIIVAEASLTGIFSMHYQIHHVVVITVRYLYFRHVEAK